MLKITERIENGWNRLTEELGEGWSDAIDLGTLDVEDHDDCIMGQLENSERYGENENLEQLMWSDWHRLGCLSRSDVFGNHRGLPHRKAVSYARAEYAMLTQAWTRRIEQHRAERNEQPYNVRRST